MTAVTKYAILGLHLSRQLSYDLLDCSETADTDPLVQGIISHQLHERQAPGRARCQNGGARVPFVGRSVLALTYQNRN